jgi:hypothetical protein
MSSYTQRVRDSILPLSIGGTLPEAFDEWAFTNETIDHEAPIETCELCGQQELRYHFQIGNRFTGHHLWVGSHCILQFNVAVIEHGRRLSPQEAKRHLNKLTQKMQLEACINALAKLASREQNPILSGALDYYRRKKKLTPKYAAVVFWKLQVELKRQQHIDDLRDMPTARVHRFWSALSPAQRKKAIELGHVPPQ